MYNKNTFINWKQMFRRTLAVGLSIVMIGSLVDLSTLSVDAQTPEEELTGIACDSLSNDVQEQKPEIGASEDAINFPDTDGKGDKPVLGEDMELPMSYESVGEYGVAALEEDLVEVTINGTAAHYSSWDSAMATLQQASNDDRLNNAKVDILLIRDVTTSASASIDFKGAEVTLHSAGEEQKTITGSSSAALLDISNAEKFTIQDIKVTNDTGSVIKVSGAKLCTNANIVIEASNAEDGAVNLQNNTTLYLNGNGNFSGKNYSIVVKGSDNRIIVGTEINKSYSVNITEQGNVDVFQKGNMSVALYGERNYKIWLKPDLPEGVSFEEAIPMDKNTDSAIEFEGDKYVLFDADITVNNVICAYQDINNAVQKIENNTLEYGGCKLLTHNTDAYGVCEYCGKTDLARAYANGHLHVEGLTGRTYDSYPQILSKVTLDLQDGTTKELVKPSYYNPTGAKFLNSPIGVGGDSPLNSDTAEYVVRYKNNAEIYVLTEGEDGFDEAKAPQVTIKGCGDYTGEFSVYFTIGKGTASLGDINVLLSNYSGLECAAWEMIPLQFEADIYDRDQFAGLIDDKYISVCNMLEAYKWYGEDTYRSNYKVEYSTDDQKTWITEKEFGSTEEKAYKITNAGEYPFYLRISGENNLFGTLISEKYIARIIPKDLSKLLQYGINVDVPEGLAAYYTGKPVLPASGYRITDSMIYRKDADGTLVQGYTLVKDTDFTVSGRNNTDITEDAALVFTGKGNYSGEIQAENKFAIKYAFTPAQTTASKDYWYNGDVPVNFGVSDNNSDTSKIVYTGSIESGVGLGSNLAVYASLDDAVRGAVSGYAFTSEGKNTQTLYIKDEDNGYIGSPVDVTVQIDKTAPVWEDADGNADQYGIQIKENWWKKLLHTISFRHFYNDETLEIKILANDAKAGIDTSGVDKYYYYVEKVADENAIDNYKVKTAEELDQLPENVADVTAGFVKVPANGTSAVTAAHLDQDDNYVIYVYAVDKAGNKSGYICTEGVVRDNTIPSYTINTPEKANRTLSDTEGTFSFEAPEDLTVLYFYVHANEFDKESAYNDFVTEMKKYYADLSNDGSDSDARYLPLAKKGDDGKWTPNFTNDGEKVEVSFGSSTKEITLHTCRVPKGHFALTISELQPSEACTIRMVSIDRAGNISASPFMSFTTTKAIPVIETTPVLTGYYGDTPQELTITSGVVKYAGKEIKGEWKLTEQSTTPLQVNTTTECQVTFIPDAVEYADTYENIVVKVRPMISKRPITINVADMTVGYGEEIPQIMADSFGIVEGEGKGLTGSDTKDTIQNTLSLHTLATKESDCGKYAFTVSSNSRNYEVTAKYCENLSDLSNPKTEGTLTITKAVGEIIRKEGFTASKTVVYKDPAFSLNVSANSMEGKLIYKISDSKNINGVSIEDDGILSVSDDGMVTVKNAGSAKVTISLPESTNYMAAAPLTVEVTVNKAQNPPQAPDSVMNVSFSCKKVSDVTLPKGWQWTPKQGQDTDLSVGNAITVTAAYTASDSVNYENLTVDVAITRSNCEHAKTERRGEVKATCAATGSTGELWCLVCGERITGSTEIPKDPANHTALTGKVTKQPTATEEGIMSYECSACGYTATKPIAKIAVKNDSDSGNSSNDSGSSSGSSGALNNVQINVTQPAHPIANLTLPQRKAPEAQKDTRPFIQGKDGKEGWDVIRAESAVCAEGGTIGVNMNGSSVVPGDIFDIIRGKDVTMEFELDNGIIWQVNGKSVQEENINDIDFHVALGEEASDTIPVDLINAMTGDHLSMNLTLAYDGAFDFEAVMRLNIGEANKGLVANLFYYNVSTDALEFICADEIDETGLAELTFTHASDYTIILDTASMELAEEANETLAEDTTGDNTIPAATTEDTTASDSDDHALFIWIIVLVCIAALTAIGCLVLKKREEEL